MDGGREWVILAVGPSPGSVFFPPSASSRLPPPDLRSKMILVAWGGSVSETDVYIPRVRRSFADEIRKTS